MLLLRMTLAGGLFVAALAGCEKKEPAPAAPPARSTTDAMKDAAKSTGDAVKDAAKTTGDAVKDAAGRAADAGRGAVDSTKEKTQGAVDWVKNQQGMRAYIETLNEGAAAMQGVKDAATSTAAESKIKEIAGKVTAQSAALAALSADDRAKLIAEYRDQLVPAVNSFRAEVTRLSTDASVSQPVADALKNIKVFEPS